jgi:hypothetical protein
MTKTRIAPQTIRHSIPGNALRAAAFALALATGGCATIGTPVSTEEAVKARVQQRWDAVVAGKWDTAYNFTSPAYRKSVDAMAYQARSSGAVKLKSAEVLAVKCQESMCEATVRIGFAPLQRGFPETSTDLDERWVSEQGEWWRYERY